VSHSIKLIEPEKRIVETPNLGSTSQVSSIGCSPLVAVIYNWNGDSFVVLSSNLEDLTLTLGR
jgi:hypothetical protein